MANEELLDRLIEVQAYRGHDLYAAFVRLLGALSDSYNEDFRCVAPDGLRFKQGAAKQCDALREVLIDGGTEVMPRV